MLYGYDSPEAVCAELMEENRKLKAEIEMLREELASCIRALGCVYGTEESE